MGLPRTSLDKDLGKDWGAILGRSGLGVQQVEPDEEPSKNVGAASRVSEALWRVSNGSDEVPVAEVTFLDGSDERIHLVFVQATTKAQRQLVKSIQQVLESSGAVVDRRDI